MESNREDALQAIRIAKKAIQDGDLEKAKHLLQKSLRICPTEQAKDLLSSLDSESQEGGATQPGSPRKRQENGTGKSPQQQSGKGTEKPASRGNSPARAGFTPEQADAVRRITSCKNYYEVLEVEKENFTVNDLKKEYRKLALLVHPDKNGAPGAAEAFQKVGNAYGVLSDDRKKAEYDAKLNRPESTQHFETSADITPEELFNVFFGKSFGGDSFAFEGMNRRRRQASHQRQKFQQQQQQQQGSEQGQTSVFLQILPVIVLVGVSLLTAFLAKDPPFSLMRSRKYPHERATSKFEVPYFVQDSFNRDFDQHSILRLEEQIEAEFLMNLRQNSFNRP